jgi:thioredoxin reductase (NADPH)
VAANDLTCELLVIGSGPAGCTAALYAARAGLKTVLSSPGEASGMMAKAALVQNFPGQIEAVPGREILARIHQQALTAGAEHVLETVNGVDFSDPARLQVYGGHREHVAAAVIVATGAMGRAKKAPGEEEFLGRGVCYCAACDGPLFAEEDVLVVGEDEQAAEEALALAGIARSVCLVLSRDDLRLDWGLQEALASRENITIRPGLKLQEIVGEEAVTGAVFRGPKGDEQVLEGAGVFVYLRGAAPATEFLGGALQADGRGFLVTDELMQTSVAGVFAAGDVRSKQVRQMVVACAEGATAALAAERLVRRRPGVRMDTGEAKG